MTDVIRIGVFFDGTGNNKDIDLLLGDGSETNIAKIYKYLKIIQFTETFYNAISV